MSRVAKNPVVIPAGVEVSILEGVFSVKGPLGALVRNYPNELVSVDREGDFLLFKGVVSSSHSVAMSGTLRALINNMVIGVTKGFERKLILQGTGYRAQAQGEALNLSLGFSHPVVYQLPKGVTAETPTQTEIVLKSVDKQLLGQVAADIRAFREPEPYKGKGVRYANEVILLKEVKKK